MSFRKLTNSQIRVHKGISFTGISTVFLCHDGEGKVLFAKRSKNTRDEWGKWEVGGGELKHGQSVEVNLKRELMEEYGVRPKKLDFIGYFDAFRTSTGDIPTHWLALCFLVLVDRTKVKINEPDKIDELGWFSLDNPPSPLHSQFPVFYKKYGKQLRKLISS